MSNFIVEHHGIIEEVEADSFSIEADEITFTDKNREPVAFGREAEIIWVNEKPPLKISVEELKELLRNKQNKA